jgi:hypothetical protein
MTRRRIVRRRVRPAAQAQAAAAQKQAPASDSPESLGLKDGEECRILIVGPANYCSFILARLGRLGRAGNIGVTAAEWHAVWAVKTLKPKVVISSIDFGSRSAGIDLMRKLQAERPEIGVILTSTAIDEIMDDRTVRDLAWGMQDSWSFVTRRKTDNGDPLGIAVVTAEQGQGWIDFPVRKKVMEWRNASRGVARVPAAA